MNTGTVQANFSDTLIEARGLVKQFGHHRALDGLNLSVKRGEVHGFLGPNGAGKTTVLRILLGLLRADSGEVRILDGHPQTNTVELHRRLAYVPGDVTLWPELSGGEVLDLLGRLRGGLNQARKKALMESFDLDPRQKVKAYSKGNRQKVALIAALAADVELLLLDEPTSGLDPLMEAVFRGCIQEARAAGRTVLLSSHILSEVEQLCQRVTIIRKGKNIQSGTLDELRHLTRTTVSAELAAPPAPHDFAQLTGLHNLRIEGQKLHCDVETASMNTLMARLVEKGILHLTCQPPSLEELFLQHYQREQASA